MKYEKTICSFICFGFGFGSNSTSPDLSKLPTGKWVDANWNATWEIGANIIKLYDAGGELVFDFNEKLEDFKFDLSLTKLTFSFRCEETERFYTFTKGTTDLDLTLDIKRDWTSEPYSVNMKLSK